MKTLRGSRSTAAAFGMSLFAAVPAHPHSAASLPSDCSGPTVVLRESRTAPGESPSSRTQDWVVRIIYFEPSDRTPRPRLEEEPDRWIYRARLWVKQEMERLGYPNRTFAYEKKSDGRLLVHTVHGTHDTAYYQANPTAVDTELNADPEYSDLTKEAQILIADVQIVNPDGTLGVVFWPSGGQATGLARKEGGQASLDLSSMTPLEEYLFDDETPEMRFHHGIALDCVGYFNGSTTVGSLANDSFAAPLHELLHAFGALHDYEADGDVMIMGQGYRRMRRSLSPFGPPPNMKLSPCHAKRLNLSPFMDPNLPSTDTSGPTVTVQQPSQGAHFPAGTPITLAARVRDTGSGVGFVEFVTTGSLNTVDCKDPGGATDTIVQTTVNGLQPGPWTLDVFALDRQGNAGAAAHRSVNIVVDSTPSGADLVPFGVCHDPPDPRPGTTVRVVAGVWNRGSTAAAAGATATWDRDAASIPTGGGGDLEGSLPSVPPDGKVYVELGTYTYGGDQELSALRIDRSNTVSEINEGNNGDWPLVFGAWPYCHGSSEIQELTVTKSEDGSTLHLFWAPTADPCQVRYRVLASTTPRPSSGAGQFPSDPDFRDLTIDDLDGNASNTNFTIAMPPGNLFFLIAGEGGTGYSGPVGHYRE